MTKQLDERQKNHQKGTFRTDKRFRLTIRAVEGLKPKSLLTKLSWRFIKAVAVKVIDLYELLKEVYD